MALRHITLFRDPTPNSFIQQRYVITIANIAKEHTDFSLEEFDNFMGELALIAWKMAATWKHLNSYSVLEDALIEAEKPKPPIETLDYQNFDYSQDLYLELDEFLVQMKSTLDYLAKLPRSIIGRSSWPELHSFGQKGKRVLDTLRNNLPKKWENSVPLIENVIGDHQDWLQMAIDARDMINHNIKGGFNIESAMVIKTTVDGKEVILVPMWIKELTLRDYMGRVWNSLMVLVEQFTIGFLSMRFKEGLGFIYNPKPLGSPISPIQILPSSAVEPVAQMLEMLRNKDRKSDT